MMRQRLTPLAVAGALSLEAATTLYVSPDGADANPGTALMPVATLAGARDKIRSLKQQSGLPAGGIVVELVPGVYQLGETFTLNAQDSGTEASPIVYRAAKRGTAVVSGGAPLAGWSPVTDPKVQALLDSAAREHVVCTAIGEDLLATIPGFANGGCGYKGTPEYPVALYQGNKRLPVSRWPNDGFTKMAECLGESVDWGRGIKFVEGRFRFEEPRLAHWAGEPDLWLDGLWYWPWADQKMRVETIDAKEKTISLADPESHSFGFKAEQEFYAFNAIGEIDRPGEWAVDRASRVLYLWPAADLATAPVTVALQPGLVRAEGVSHVRFEDLVFEHSIATAIQIRNGTAVTVSGSTLRHTGSWGVDVSGGSDCTVIGCDLHDLGEGGIKAWGGDQSTLTPGNHLIENNHIHHFGQFVNTYRPGAAVYGVGNKIRHNLIHHAQHQAMFFNGNDHLIEYNVIHDVCLHTSDAGALYACARDWSQRGVVIRHNFIHSTAKGVDGCGSHGIYLDDYTSGATVVGNIVSSVGHAVTTCGNGNLIENNLAINSRKYSFALSSRGVDSFAKNNAAKGMDSPLVTKLLANGKPYTSDAWKARYPHLGQLLDKIQSDPVGAHDSHFCTMRDNINVGGVPAYVRNAEKVIPTGTIEANINTYEDPGFVDLRGFDLRFRPDAPILKRLQGFQPLEFEKMGLYADARRASPAVKFGDDITPMPEMQPRIPEPELKPRYAMEDLTGRPFRTDGIPEPKEWPDTRKPHLECMNEIYKAPSKHMTDARVGVDGTQLRLLITVNVDADKTLKTDGKWGSRDGIELAFSDTGEDVPVFLLHAYPGGDFEVTSPMPAGATLVKDAAKAVTCGSQIEAGKYTVELGVPLAAFGIQPKSLQQLRFNMNVHRTCDGTWTCWWTPGNGINDLLSSGLLVLPREMPETKEMARRRHAAEPLVKAEQNGELRWQLVKDWAQTADPDCLGPDKQPADAPAVSFSAYAGWVVCRKTVELSAEQLTAPFCALFVPCIDEEGHVYVNGKRVLSHTAEDTGVAPGQLWREPVLIDLKPVVGEAGTVHLSVHLRGNMGTGGLRKGAFLVWGKVQPSAEQLYDFLAGSTTLGWRDRVPAFWQDFERVRIPQVPPAPDEADFGKRIQRTMDLLSSSTPGKRNRVRILFYGQSITAGVHAREIVNVLRSHFPWAIIDFENRAIGGFSSPSLVRTAEHDLYPLDADLVIFHVYGDAENLDRIFGNMRRRNSSDILVYTHHYNWVSNPAKLEEKLAYLARSTVEWHELAEKYQMELAPVNRDWPLFFRKHDWGINEVMGDAVHSNVHHNPTGHALLAKLILRNFRHHPGNPATFPSVVTAIPLDSPGVGVIGKWEKSGYGLRTSEGGASLRVTFDGNRVDVLPLPAAKPGTARILIDGKPPTEFRELYTCTRPSNGPYIWMPAIKRVDLGEDVLPRPETWTLTPFDVNVGKGTLSFRLEGSLTGPDGVGDKTADFVSDSGRIKLSRSDFYIIWPCTYRDKDALPDDYKVTWEIQPLFVDPWRADANVDSAVKRPVTLVKGLPNGRHTIEIIANGDGEIPIEMLIVRRPPLE